MDGKKPLPHHGTPRSKQAAEGTLLANPEVQKRGNEVFFLACDAAFARSNAPLRDILDRALLKNEVAARQDHTLVVAALSRNNDAVLRGFPGDIREALMKPPPKGYYHFVFVEPGIVYLFVEPGSVSFFVAQQQRIEIGGGDGVE